MDVKRYLSRIRYHGDTRPTLENLRAIHLAHMLAVPFENLSIHCGDEIVLDLQLIYNKIVVKRRGGLCYELNGLFSWLLKQLGFSSKIVSAQGYRPLLEVYGREMGHCLNVVSIGGEDWVADVGNMCLFRTPIRLAEDQEHTDVTGTYRLRLEGDMWFLQRLKRSASATKLENACCKFKAAPGGTQGNDMARTRQWVTKYKFTLQERELQDFGKACNWTQQFHHVFSVQPVCVLHLANGLITCMGRELTTARYGIRVTMATRRLESDDDILKVLRDTFGVKLDKHLKMKD
ncbi:acetyltransferase [Branchiostoma belcheri]|nr:acetyltransferase [Branchiostoma belcheri]